MSEITCYQCDTFVEDTKGDLMFNHNKDSEVFVCNNCIHEIMLDNKTNQRSTMQEKCKRNSSYITRQMYQLENFRLKCERNMLEKQLKKHKQMNVWQRLMFIIKGEMK